MLKEVKTAEFEELFDKGVVLVDFFLQHVDHVKCYLLY